MSDPESPEEETAAEPVKVKQVAIAAGIVTAALTAAVAFTVAGPLGVGIAAAGVAGTGYTAHRIRNPKTGRPGVLHSWLTRSRRPSKTGGSLTWPFTGNQSKRALTSGRAGGRSSRSKLPSLTSTRAKRSAGLTGTRSKAGGPKRSNLSSNGKASSARSLPITSKRSTRPGSGSSLRRGKPGSKPVTPAKLTSSKPGLSTRSGKALSKRSLPLSMRSKPRSGSSATRRTSGGIASGHKPSTRGPFSTTRRGGGGKWRNPFQGTRGGQSLGGRSTGSRRTGRGQRLGGTLGGPSARRGPLGRLRNRATPDLNRTRLRPRPYARKTAGSLLRTSLRLPVRNRTTTGSRRVIAPFRRPSVRQAKRARRTLRLRSGVHLRHAAKWVLSTPARRWDRLWSKLPTAPLPLTHYTERAGMKTPTGPKYHRPPISIPGPTPYVPQSRDITLIPITRNGEVIHVSSPVEVIVEAFQQLAMYHPGSAKEIEQVLVQQTEMFAQIGAAYSNWADQLRDGMPFEAAVADSVREIGHGAAAVGSVAQNAHQTYRTAHAADIARYEDPRADEGMWNPENNR